VHLDLIVAGIGVHETKEFMSCRGFYQLIDHRERVTILLAGFVEIYKVDLDSPLSAFFLHEDGEPVGVERFPDESRLE